MLGFQPKKISTIFKETLINKLPPNYKLIDEVTQLRIILNDINWSVVIIGPEIQSEIYKTMILCYKLFYIQLKFDWSKCLDSDSDDTAGQELGINTKPSSIDSIITEINKINKMALDGTLNKHFDEEYKKYLEKYSKI